MQQVLLRHADRGLRQIGGRGEAFAEEHHLLRRRGRRGAGEEAVGAGAIDPEVQVVVAGHDLADDAGDAGGDLGMAGDDRGIGGGGEHDGALAAPGCALDLDAGLGGGGPAGAGDADAAVVQRLEPGRAHMQHAFRFRHMQRVRLFIKAVRGDRDGGGGAGGVHAFQLEALAGQGAEHRVPPARGAADGSAFDDLRHMHRRPGRVAEQQRHGGEDRGIAGPAGEDDVRLLSERPEEGLGPRLADDLRGAVDHFRGCFPDPADGADAAGGGHRLQPGAVHVRMDDGELRGDPVLPRDPLQQRDGGGEVGRGTGGPGAADQQGHAGGAGAMHDEAEVAEGDRFRGRHAPCTQVVGPGVDRAHVAADGVRFAGEAGPQRRFGDAVAELAGGGEDAERLAGARAVVAKPGDDAHSTTPSSGRCCCAP